MLLSILFLLVYADIEYKGLNFLIHIRRKGVRCMSVCENQIASETSDLQPAPPAIDAAVHVSIPHGGLTANIIIDPPSGGGAQPTLEALESALAENGVCYNVDLQTLRSLVERPVYNHAISIATGVAPIDGVDGTAVFQFETDKKVLRPKKERTARWTCTIWALWKTLRKIRFYALSHSPPKAPRAYRWQASLCPSAKDGPSPAIWAKTRGSATTAPLYCPILTARWISAADKST
jgi:hypothetical protein